MWQLIVRSSEKEPKEINLKFGKSLIGRQTGNDILIEDVSASRRHAEIDFDFETDRLTIRDLNSTNGTFVNRQRIRELHQLQPNDIIRIGQVTITLVQVEAGAVPKAFTGTHRLSRDLLLEALDQHAVLLYEAASKLNMVIDIKTALSEVSELMKRALGAHRCQVILETQFSKIKELGFPETIAKEAIEKRSAVIAPDLQSTIGEKSSKSAALLYVRSAMCVPILSSNTVLGLIYMYRIGDNARPYDKRDLQLAVAISHQASMTIQRMILMETIHQQQQVQLHLNRFLSPQESEFLLKNYQKSGSLPELSEKKVTVLFADIAGSTQLADQLGPQQFGKTLTRFYADAMDIVFAHQGTIKLMGDGILAIFIHSESSNGSPEENAVRAGMQLIERVTHTALSDPNLRVIIGIGINTGMALVGYVGSQDQIEFTALGETINVASRIQDYARPNRLMIGLSTYSAVLAKFHAEPVNEIPLRGKELPLRIFEIPL